MRETILYQGADFAVLNKPSGVTFAQAVALALAEFRGAACEVVHGFDGMHAVHRLDRGTSGCLVVGWTPSARRRLSGAFEKRRVEKEYLALVSGSVGLEPEGVIAAPLLTESVEAGGYHYSRTRVDSAGKAALTHYRLLASDGYCSLLALKPHTGRTHQLRVHCAEGLGHPIIADEWYGNREPGVPLMLHAFSVSLPEQGRHAAVTVTAPLPPYMAARAARLGWGAVGFAPRLGLGEAA